MSLLELALAAGLEPFAGFMTFGAGEDRPAGVALLAAQLRMRFQGDGVLKLALNEGPGLVRFAVQERVARAAIGTDPHAVVGHVLTVVAAQAQSLSTALAQSVTRVRDRVAPFFETLREFGQRHAGRGDDDRLLINRSIRVQPDWADIESAWFDVDEQLAQVTGVIEEVLSALEQANPADVLDRFRARETIRPAPRRRRARAGRAGCA